MTTFDDFSSLCKNRHSIRYFDETPVTKEQVFHLLELAQLAPSVQNTQPWHFHIIENRGLLHKLMEASCYGNFVEGAGIFIIITCDTSVKPADEKIIWNPHELEYSCVTAMEHILLGAAAMGLASCFVSLHHGTAHELLSLPHNQIIIGGVMLGYPHKDATIAQEERDRKPLKEVFTLY